MTINTTSVEEAASISRMSGDQAIAYLENKKPGFLELNAYNEFKAAEEKYPANLPMKKLALAIMPDIEKIENEDDRNAAKRVFMRAVFDVSENGLDGAGAKYFLDKAKLNLHFNEIVRSDDDPNFARQAREKAESRKNTRKLGGAALMVAGGLGALISAKALATKQPMLNLRAFDNNSSFIHREGDVPQKDDSTTSKVAVFLASLVVTAAGAYGTLGRQPSDAAENLVHHLNERLDEMINQRVRELSADGSPSR